MPLEFWLGFPEGLVISPYQMGMVRQMLLDSCNPDWDFMQRMAEDLSHQLDDDTIFFTEHSLVYHWVHSALEYEKWYISAKIDFSVTALDLLDPPAFVFRPDRKDQLRLFFKYGRIRATISFVNEKLRFRWTRLECIIVSTLLQRSCG